MWQDRGDAVYQVPDHRLSTMIISQRGKWWAQQCLRAQQECWERVRLHRATNIAEIRQGYVDVEKELDTLLGEEKELHARHQPMTMSSAAVSYSDLQFSQRCMESSQHCSPSRLRIARSSLVIGPPPLSLVSQIQKTLKCGAAANLSCQHGWVSS